MLREVGTLGAYVSLGQHNFSYTSGKDAIISHYRWIKYEEDREAGAERWGKAHISSLSFHALINLRLCLEKGKRQQKELCKPHACTGCKVATYRHMYRAEPKEPAQLGSVSGSEIQNLPFSLSGIISLYRLEPKEPT